MKGGAVRFLIFVGLVSAATASVDDTDVKSILEIVPKDERPDFLSYYIQRGQELSERGIDRSTPDARLLTDEFAVLVYQFARTRSVICFDDGTCIDIGDVGVHPKKK